MKKYITIAIPNYNHGFRLEKVINSAINQSLDNSLYEILIVDDGSTDDSMKILKKFKKNIKVISQKNMGISKTREVLIKSSSKKSTHIYFLDADDTMSKELLEQHYYHEINEDKFVSADIQIWEDTKKIKATSKLIMKNNKYSIAYSTCTSKLWRKKDIEKIKWPNRIKNEDDYTMPLMLKNRRFKLVQSGHINVLNEPNSLSKQVDTTNAKKIVDLALDNWEINDRNLSFLVHSICTEGAFKYLKKQYKSKLPGFWIAKKYIGPSRAFADFWVKKIYRDKSN